MSESIEEQVKKVAPQDIPKAIEQARKDARAYKDQIEKTKQANNDAQCK